ncbi:MAG TPA: helix-turn-helix domain-containing protein [Bryobacteraceae bacterium]|nr:helix-turn-helix domain-containing protein [Bryobacteraceae bacterium]
MRTKKETKPPVRRRRAERTAFGSEWVKSMRQALAYAKGEELAARVTAVMVPNVDVREIRRRLGLSQSQFAAKFGFAPASVRNWEQRRRVPDGPARILLAVIGEHPEVVESVLRKTA